MVVRTKVLGDLIAQGQIVIEVMLAVEARLWVNSSAQGDGSAYDLVEAVGIESGQGTGEGCFDVCHAAVGWVEGLIHCSYQGIVS